MNPSKPQLRPVTIVRWRDGKRIIVPDVQPIPFGTERAAKIWTNVVEIAREPIIDALHKATTSQEDAYIMTVWEAISDPQASYLAAFQAIARGEVSQD